MLTRARVCSELSRVSTNLGGVCNESRLFLLELLPMQAMIYAIFYNIVFFYHELIGAYVKLFKF